MDFNLKNYLDIHGKGYVIKMLYPKNNKFVIDTLVDGYAEIKPNFIKMEEDHLFDVASLTKTITAIIVHKAVENGLFKLDDKIKIIDGRFIYLDNVSILDLLTHKQELWTDGYLGNACSKEEFMQMLFNSVVKNKKRTYIDSHYIILSVILEKVYKISFEEIVEKEIISVLGLKNTKFKCNKDDNVVSNNYETTSNNFFDNIEIGICRDNKAKRACELGFYIGNAGLFTTTTDFLMILKALVDDEYKLLSKSSIASLLLYDDATLEIKDLINQFIIDNSIDIDNNSDINVLYKKIVDLGYSNLRLHLFKPYNYFGTRYKNIIKNMNDIPEKASLNTVLFSGYTGPLFLVDFDRKIVIVIMTNVCHCNILSRDDRYNKSKNLINELYEEVLKQMSD